MDLDTPTTKPPGSGRLFFTTRARPKKNRVQHQVNYYRPDAGTRGLFKSSGYTRETDRPVVNCRAAKKRDARGRKQNGFASGQGRGPGRRGAGLPAPRHCAARLSTRRARLAQGQQPHVVEDPGPVRVLPGTRCAPRTTAGGGARSWPRRRRASTSSGTRPIIMERIYKRRPSTRCRRASSSATCYWWRSASRW